VLAVKSKGAAVRNRFSHSNMGCIPKALSNNITAGVEFRRISVAWLNESEVWPNLRSGLSSSMVRMPSAVTGCVSQTLTILA